MINVDQVYIICSAQYESDKYNQWKLWLEKNIIKGQIFFYKWGSDLTQKEIDSYVVRDGTLEHLYPWRTGYPIRNSEASVAINFIKIFKDAADKKYNNILILESDVTLHPDFIEKLNAAIASINHIDFNVLSIGCGMGYRLNTPGIAKVNQFRCADSLVFTKTAINYLNSTLKQIKVPIDEEFTQAVQRDELSVCWLEPPLAIQNSQMPGNTSSIQNGNYNLQLPW
jgi:hypothetical protein